MTRLKAISPEMATGKTKELFNAVQGKLGIVPNMMRTMGNSSALLEGYLNLSGALSSGTINAKTGELIALTVAESNGCDYCLSAHTYIGKNLVKIDDDTLHEARNANSKDPKIDAALKFAKNLVENKGKSVYDDVEELKNAGYSEGEIGEIVGHVALNILTNYFNIAAQTEIDFPKVEVYQNVTI